MHLYKSGKNNHLLTQQKTSGVGRLLSPSHLDKKASVAKISASLLQNIKKKIGSLFRKSLAWWIVEKRIYDAKTSTWRGVSLGRKQKRKLCTEVVSYAGKERERPQVPTCAVCRRRGGRGGKQSHASTTTTRASFITPTLYMYIYKQVHTTCI